MWRFASYTELIKVFEASAITVAIHIVFITLLFGRMPMTYYLWGSVLQFLLILAVRFSYRFILLERARRRQGEEITGR
jgi:FlaA1/EpsC-like NDP-sugar epimerase